MRRQYVLAFGAKWCSVCQANETQLKRLTGRVVVQHVDYDEQPSLVRKFKIELLPTYVLVNSQGKEVARTGEVMTLLSWFKYPKLPRL
jgi:thioredoxin-like negative regulator of GroEL